MKGIRAAVFAFWAIALFCPLVGRAQEASAPQLIESVKVVGNDYIPAEGILDEVKNLLQPGQPYTPESAQAAQQAVLRMGYFDDVQITTEPGPRGLIVVIRVVEKKRIQKIVFVGNTVLDDTALSEAIFTRVGHIIDDRLIRRDVRRIEEAYAKQGYIAHVSNASVNEYGVLTFVLEEARIEDIVIEGLKKTKRWVVERELTIKPGDLFHDKKIARDLQRLYNLELFSKVNSDIRPGVKDPQRGVILVINLEEKRTGELALAAAYSNLDKFVLMLSIAENNFRGRAERVALNVELFGRTSYEFSFFEPYLDKRGTTLTTRLYDTQRQRRFLPSAAALSVAEDRFDERRTGGILAFSRPLNPTTRLSLRFRSEKVYSSYLQGTRIISGSGEEMHARQEWSRLPDYWRRREYPPGNPDLLPEIPEPGDTLGPIIVAAPLHHGGQLTSLQLGWTRDTRNLIANPTSGLYTALTLEQAGRFLGGTTTFSKIMAEQRYYRKVSAKSPDVLAARLMLGTTIGDLPLFESFSVGGANTLRGYEEDRYRGKHMAAFSLEYRRPITDRLTAVGFVDVGGAFGGVFETVVPGFRIPAEDRTFKPHVGAGVGIRVITPLGPIRLDFGWGEEGGQAHFSFGHTF